MSTAKREAYDALDAAVRHLTQLVRDEASEDDDSEDDDSPETVVDWVLVVGSQFFTDEGDRHGAVTIMPKAGAQPAYITVGLLREALGKY
ncbi:hypothetical protein CH300_20080 [Rhodococcus sp. 15-1154-1]|nr:hypothetical protein [Rhodococcus sp. 15-1154-1]OZF00841.1 hypothetical protein CH300_20080 [Rhodococcus sp. 15-1154-1]